MQQYREIIPVGYSVGYKLRRHIPAKPETGQKMYIQFFLLNASSTTLLATKRLDCCVVVFFGKNIQTYLDTFVNLP